MFETIIDSTPNKVNPVPKQNGGAIWVIILLVVCILVVSWLALLAKSRLRQELDNYTILATALPENSGFEVPDVYLRRSRQQIRKMAASLAKPDEIQALAAEMFNQERQNEQSNG